MTIDEALNIIDEENFCDCDHICDECRRSEALDTIRCYFRDKIIGHWINHRNDLGHNIADCSICGKAMQWHDEDEDGVPRYCWYCGASMQGDPNGRN